MGRRTDTKKRQEFGDEDDETRRAKRAMDPNPGRHTGQYRSRLWKFCLRTVYLHNIRFLLSGYLRAQTQSRQQRKYRKKRDIKTISDVANTFNNFRKNY